MFPTGNIVMANLIGQKNPINQWKCFIQLDAVELKETVQPLHRTSHLKQVEGLAKHIGGQVEVARAGDEGLGGLHKVTIKLKNSK